MGIFRTTSVFCLVVFFLMCSYSQHAHASPIRASRNKRAIMHHCKGYMRKHLNIPFLDPDDSECCKVVKKCNVKAICDAFTADDLADISLHRWANITHACHNKLTEGTDCAGMFLLVIS